MTRMKPLYAAALLGLFAVAAPAAADDTVYRISADLSHAEASLGTPTLRVRPGTAATIEVSGADGYTLTLTVNEADDGALQIDADLRSAHGDMAPQLVVVPGRRADVQLGALRLGLTVDRETPPANAG